MARSNWFSSRRASVFNKPRLRRKPQGFRSRWKSQRLQLETLEDRRMLSANVVTDQLDYPPGATAQILASDFAVGETVQFQVLHTDGTPNTGFGHEPWQVTDGLTGDFDGDGVLDGDLDGIANGNIHTTWYVHPDDSGGSAFELNATGLSSGFTALHTFTDSIAFQGSGTANSSSSSRTSATFSHTVGAGSERLLLVSVLTNGDEDVTSITYAGQPLTQAIERDSGDSDGTAAEIWYLIAPPVGTANVVVNFADSVDPSYIRVDNLTGVHQTNPIGTTAGADATSGTSMSVNITTTTANSIVYGAAAAHGGDTDPFSSGSGISERWDSATGFDSSSDIGVWGGFRTAATVQNYTFNATSSSSDDWAIAAIEVRMAPETPDTAWTATLPVNTANDHHTTSAYNPSGGAGAETPPSQSYQADLYENWDPNVQNAAQTDIVTYQVAGDDHFFYFRFNQRGPVNGNESTVFHLEIDADFDDVGGDIRSDYFVQFNPSNSDVTAGWRNASLISEEVFRDGNNNVGGSNLTAPDSGDPDGYSDAVSYGNNDVFGRIVGGAVEIAVRRSVANQNPDSDIRSRGWTKQDGNIDKSKLMFHDHNTASDLSSNRIDNTHTANTTTWIPTGGQPAINIEKLVNGQDADTTSGQPILAVGSTATFTYVVTNTGNVALSGVTVVDDNGTPGNLADDFNAAFTSGDTNANGLLDLTETWTFTASRIVTAGQYTNIGKATGQGANQTVMDTDPANHFGAAPSINIEKLVNGQDADTTSGQPILAVGSTATFTYVVTNTGNVALSSIVVVDDNGTPGNTADDFNATFTSGDTNTNGLLDLGETWAFTASRIVTAGQYTNIGKATGQGANQTVMDTDPANHFGARAAIDIEKLVNGQDADLPTGPIVPVGSTATFTYIVTNTGNIALSNVAVVDDNGTPGNSADDFNATFTGGDTNSNGLLDLSETWTFTASRIVTAGQYTNIGTASGQAAGQTAMDTDPANHFGAAPAIDVEKLVNGQDADTTSGQPILAVGSIATFTYLVTNTGNIALSNVVVVDDNGTPANLADDFNASFTSGDTNANGLLDLSETWTFTASRIVTAGQYTNIGKATGQAAGQTVMDTDPANHFGAAPAIDIEKLVNGQDADLPTGPIVPVGSTATFTYIVTNAGNIALSTVVVVDDNGTPGNLADDFNPSFTGGDANSNGLLDLGETWTYTASRIVTAGQYTNIGKASGQAAGQTAMDADAANHFGKRDPIIVIGPDKGNTSYPIVRLVNQLSGNIITQFYVYEPNFLGGVRIATGDMTGDGIDEIIVAPGQGRVGEVRVFTQLGAELIQFRTLPYGASYYGGVEVAVGDVNGDGKNDIVTTPSYGRTEVRVFFNNFDSGNPSADPIGNSPDKQFYVFASSFLGGADVIVADVGTFNNGATLDALTPDGKGEIIVGNGPGMRSTIVVFDVTGAASVVDTILPFSNSFKGGITLSAARINGDAIPDFIVAAGNKGGSIVEIRSGVTNDATDVLLAAFSAFGDTATKNAPVHATALDTNGDGISDLLAVVQGTNGTSNQIRYFSTAGTWLGSHFGFVGPWNIASLNNVDPSLPDSTAITPAAVDQAYNEIASASSMTKKAMKKLAKAKKKK